MSRMRFPCWIPVASLLLAACASERTLERRSLPYAVGVVLADEPVVGEVAPGELPGKATDLVLDLEPGRVTSRVVEALQTYCFSRAQVLDAGSADASLAPLVRRRAILERARSEGLDLIADLSLRYDREIYRKNSSVFWMNFPLYLTVGPLIWFLADNEYHADVELTVSMYDVNALEAGDLDIGDPTARVFTINSRYTGARLDFLDRADGVTHYLFSMLVPSGYLARESDSVHERVLEEILAELEVQLVQGMQGRRSDLIRSQWIAPVFVDPGTVSLRREGAELLVKGEVALLRGGAAERVDAVNLCAGGAAVAVRPAPSSSDASGEYDLVPFEARVPVGEGARELRLECEAGARDHYVRSYTFLLPE